jgi:uncharacterized membrane protein
MFSKRIRKLSKIIYILPVIKNVTKNHLAIYFPAVFPANLYAGGAEAAREIRLRVLSLQKGLLYNTF